MVLGKLDRYIWKHEVKTYSNTTQKNKLKIDFLLFRCSVASMDCSKPGFLVIHYLLEFAQTHVHWNNDAIQPSHPLLSPSPPAFDFSQHQGSFLVSRLFTSGGQSIGASASASVLPVSIQDWFPLGLTGWISLLSKELSRVFSNTTVQKHQFFSAQLTL